MNDRIQELLLKAKVKVWHNGGGLLSDKAFEIVAELIVQECVAQCWTVSEMEHKGNVISECSKRMRKHFGVE